MSYCKNIGIWCILLTLLETTKQFVILEEDGLHTLRIPYDSKNSINKGEIQYFPDDKHYIDDYSKIEEYAPFQHEEQHMQEYDDYRDEKDLPNLSKGGLFSWWKNEPERKKPKSGTFSPVANEIVNEDANTIVDPNEKNTAVDANAPATADITAMSDTTASTNTTASADTTGSANNNVSADIAVNANTSVSTNTTQDPAALSGGTSTTLTTPTTSLPTASTFLTTCICYNVTEECIPIFIPTPDSCLSNVVFTASTSSAGGNAVASSSSGSTTVSTTTVSGDNTATTPAVNGSTVSQNTTVSAALNDTTVGQTTTISVSLSNSTVGQNTTASLAINNTAANLNAKATSLTANGSDTTSSQADSTSVANTIAAISMPTVLNMYGAGMILPVYELPMTPFVMESTKLPTTKKKKTYHKLKIDRNSQTTIHHSNNIFNNNYDPRLYKNIVNQNNNMVNRIPNTDVNPNKDNHTFLPEQKSDSVVLVNSITSPSNTISSAQIAPRNNSFSLDEMTAESLENKMLRIDSNQTLLQPLEKHTDNTTIIFDQKLTSSSNGSGELIQSQMTEELLNQPYNKYLNELNAYNYSNSQISIPTEPPKTITNTLPEDYSPIGLNNINQTTDNKIPDAKNFNNNFVKYNATYLSQNSNTSTDLVELCKNVTCLGNNTLSECCSRVSGPEKFQEDFSCLQPISGYFNITMRTTIKNLEPLSNAQPTVIDPMPINATLLLYTVGKSASQPTSNIETSTSNCSCGSKPKKFNRVVRENDMNDFVKFQLMHGMTAPDGKEMMNALKEANLEIQKVNREFHSNDPVGNIYKMNGNGKNIHLPVIDKRLLSKKESEGVSPFSSNKILDDLRATISNSLLQSNLKPSPFQRDRYRFIRNQGLKDQMESIRENSMILEKIKKETEMELQRLCLLENKRREEELLFDKKRENELKELKTIQDLIHREFESRTQGDSEKRAISETAINHTKQNEPTKKGSIYSKIANNIDNSGRNDEFNNLMLDRYSSLGSNTSNSYRPSSNFVDVEKFPELEINNSVNLPRDDALLLLNIGSDKEVISEKQRKRREGSNNAENKILKEYIKSVYSTENNNAILR